ncbi:hypothetical protein [Flavobacterium sp. N1719]|uniref:hypothetical protein n=1 Tax=Flavobacterium sp. N1719 TaxID=2885633 RepID=UPI0022212BD5|nr:hypothetical protein [Flavobacterium sp. N1719]
MKRYFSFVLVVLGMATTQAQDENLPEFTGDNFSLEGALTLFQKANSLEEFEQLLNQENNGVNNLDLNGDGTIDYIQVDDYQEGDTHAIVLSTYLSENEKQDIAVIGVEKTGTESAQLQIEGDEDLYAANTIVEPTDVAESVKENKGPNPPYYSNQPLVVNVWLWPSVRFIYRPGYVVWRSPWRWGTYPKFWRPWRPVSYTVFYSRCAPHRVYFHRVPTRRVVIAHRIYKPMRRHSTVVVHNRRGTKVVRRTPRGTTVIRTPRGGGRRR